MPSPAERARAFVNLHVPGQPVVLYNVWDAGSARVVAQAGAKALATGSWSVAMAHGYGDGEEITAVPVDSDGGLEVSLDPRALAVVRPRISDTPK